MAQYHLSKVKFNSNNNTQFEAFLSAMNGSVGHFPLANGQINGISHINKFGYSDNIATLSTIWDGSNIYTYSSSAGAVTATSSSSDDDGAVVEIQGLDADYNLTTYDLTLGSTGATNLIRIFRVRLKTPAAGQTTNVGAISVNIAGQLRAKILAGNGQTLMALYTIPAGKTGYLLNLTMSVDKNVDVIYKLFCRKIDDGAFNLKGQFGTFGTPVDHTYPVPLKFEEKTDIEIRADAGNTSGGGATFDLILVDNPT